MQETRRFRFDPWSGKITWRREWLPTDVFLPEESHGQRSLVGYSPGGRKESDTTEWPHTHTLPLSILLCLDITERQSLPEANVLLGNMLTNIFPGGPNGKESTCQCRRQGDSGLIPDLGRSPGEGNGNSLQYSCLGNPMHRGPWWATVHGVAKESDMT